MPHVAVQKWAEGEEIFSLHLTPKDVREFPRFFMAEATKNERSYSYQVDGVAVVYGISTAVFDEIKKQLEQQTDQKLGVWAKNIPETAERIGIDGLVQW
ncbi:hypothetical protein KTR10_01890 [Candidatus Kaiserbacteria bacterium]|nr:hypothetical protein [Candidatus Kaiserbacteria bacterium]